MEFWIFFRFRKKVNQKGYRFTNLPTDLDQSTLILCKNTLKYAKTTQGATAVMIWGCSSIAVTVGKEAGEVQRQKEASWNVRHVPLCPAVPSHGTGSSHPGQ